MEGISTRFTDEYGIRHPIAAAGMAFVSLTPDLPVAVCEAGALGAFAAGPFPLEFVRANLRKILEATDKPVNLNCITPFATPEHIDLCVEEKPAVVSFHWEHPPREWITRLQEAGIRVWEQVGTPEAARRAVDDGVDLIIAQGSEAGGHCYGHLPLSVVVPAVVDAVDGTLVLAAGGIVDGRGLAAALALGADGASVGTRLMVTPESDVADEYKERVVQCQGLDTVLSSMFGRHMPDFNPMRVIRNQIVEEWHGRLDEIDQLPRQPSIGTMPLLGQETDIVKLSGMLPVEGATGEFEQMALTAGQGLGGIRQIEPAAQVIETMVSEARTILGGMRLK